MIHQGEQKMITAVELGLSYDTWFFYQTIYKGYKAVETYCGNLLVKTGHEWRRWSCD